MNHYERLGADPSSDFQTIKKAYYRQVKKCHPDLFGGSREKEEEFKLLVCAFDILSDPDKRKRYDISRGIALEPVRSQEWVQEGYSVMDTEADDTLEEIIVGNNLPAGATLGSLFLDLEKTDVFISFREGKNYFRSGSYRNALNFFIKVVNHSPNNILYRYYLAKTYCALNRFSDARMHYSMAINLGERRMPPQRLRRIHDELDAISIRKSTFWRKISGLFVGEKKKMHFVDSEDDMVSELNRAIARIMAERRNRNDDRKLLK